MQNSNAEFSVVDQADQTSRILQLAEIAAVFASGVIALLSVTSIFGGGRVASIVGVWMANLTMLAVIFCGLRFRKQKWGHLGLNQWIWEWKSICGIVLRSVPVFVAAIVAFLIGAILMANIVGMPESADMSKYDYLRGNLVLTLVALGSVCIVSAFAEEMIYRGFMITRLIELGSGRRSSIVIAVGLSSLIFGLVHSDWGLAGMVQASCMGVALGISYLVVKRNLWVTIFAHAYMDTILILQMYAPTA